MGWFHKHKFEEHYGGMYADEEGGPQYAHEIWWECRCGKVIDSAAKARALWAKHHNVVAILPRRVIYADQQRNNTMDTKLELDEPTRLRVQQVIAKQLEVPVEQVQPGSSVVSDLGGDSLSLIEVCLEIEDELHIQFFSLPEKADMHVQEFYDLVAKARN